MFGIVILAKYGPVREALLSEAQKLNKFGPVREAGAKVLHQVMLNVADVLSGQQLSEWASNCGRGAACACHVGGDMPGSN